MSDCTALRCSMPSEAVCWFVMEQPSGDWPAELSAAIAAEVRRHRLAKGMSAQQLSDACAALGMAIPRSVLSNLENGRRESVSVAEVLVLAAALGVPPAALIFPVGYATKAHPLPGIAAHPMDAVFWFAGEASLWAASGAPDADPSLDRPDYRVVHRPDGTPMKLEAEPMVWLRQIVETEAAIEEKRAKASRIRQFALDLNLADHEITAQLAVLAEQIVESANEEAENLDFLRQHLQRARAGSDLSYPPPVRREVRAFNTETILKSARELLAERKGETDEGVDL